MLELTKYGRLGASSRMRSWQYLPWLQQAGFDLCAEPLFSDEMLEARYESGGYRFGRIVRAYFERCRLLLQRHSFDVVWIEKEALPWWPLWVESMLLRGVPYVLDYDDAIFHNYDQHRRPWVRRIYGKRLDGLMKKAALVVAGNSYLAQRARDAGAARVEIIPTVVDLERYSLERTTSISTRGDERLLRIVWIGSPSTVAYLDMLREPLQSLSKRRGFVFRVIGGGNFDIPGVNVEVVPWSEDTEVDSIRECDIGVMPLLDSKWERGKCGYKIIQYMACGLPVVASNIGVNSEIVMQGESGVLVNSNNEWVFALEKLMSDQALRAKMGVAGRECVEKKYCLQKTAPRLIGLLRTTGRL
ncbi:MAG: glycosyltransferase family 4 protein [Pseudomonadota bacterium]